MSTVPGQVHCQLYGDLRSAAKLDVELDGVIVASRELHWVGPAFTGDSTTAVSMTFRSGPLVGGAHEVRIFMDDLSIRTACTDYTLCLGSAENDRQQARLVVLELLPN